MAKQLDLKLQTCFGDKNKQLFVKLNGNNINSGGKLQKKMKHVIVQADPSPRSDLQNYFVLAKKKLKQIGDPPRFTQDVPIVMAAG